jgi:3-dehydroquinate dehydratase I
MPTLLRPPKICVSIGTPNLEVLRRDIDRALATADFAEVRFDYFAKADIAAAVRAVVRDRERLVFTLRSEKEGGKFTGDANEYGNIVSYLGSARPMLLDIEFENSWAFNWRGFPNEMILLSQHYKENTPRAHELRLRRLDMTLSCDNVVKIVTKANAYEDVNNVLSLYDHFDDEFSSGTKLIAFAMGELGVRSRIKSAIHPRSPFGFATLDKAVAPGQLTVEQMQEECAKAIASQ